MTQLLVLFTILNIVNVIIQTVKSIVTVKCGKTVASIVNALAYGLCTVVTVYTMCDLPLLTKALVVAICNLIGVYVVKLIEEKARKDKLWLVKMTIPHKHAEQVKTALETAEIPFSYVDIQKYVIFDTYCYTQKDTAKVAEICKTNKGKMFATENKM